jgi:uncharacterized protein (TIGR04141 family)
MAEKTNKLSICLVKAGVEDIDVVQAGCHEVPVDGLGVFYTKPSFAHPPEWLLKFFKGQLPDDLPIKTASARGVLVTSLDRDDTTYVFAVLFGNGRHLLNDDVLEERFGLKVVLNSVNSNNLRSIDKLNMGSFSKQSREQIGHEGEAANFGIDIEQDLLRAVTGRSNVAKFGKMITGKDAFATSAKFDVDDIRDLLEICLTQYLSDAYKQDFDWIDQLEDVRSSAVLASLNAELVARINASNFDRMWMAPPDIVSWADVLGFKYARPKKGDLHEDLSMLDLLASADGKPLTLEWLRGTSVYLISAEDEETHLHWPAYRCIYAEIVEAGSLFVLNAGKWYKVDDDFTQSVNDDFAGIPDAVLQTVAYHHENEGAYNVALSASLHNSVCLDADMIPHGGGKSSIEFCDVLTADRKLVHVKRYSGSAQLSHLFAQGAVSAEAFASDPSFREKVNAKLPPHLQLADTTLRPNTAEYEVVYAIISRSNKPLDVPFFSKVTVRNAARQVRGFGYKVSKLKIPVAAN